MVYLTLMKRENVFYLVFEAEFQKGEINPPELLEMAQELGVVENDTYTERVFFGVMNELESLDSKIEELSRGWKLDRIFGAVDLQVFHDFR